MIDERIKLPISARWREGSHFSVKAVDGELTVEVSPTGVVVLDEGLAYGGVA
jgi:hypothetical protein